MTSQALSSFSLRGLRVAVTGGTSGLGRALVEHLHAQGARVAFVARRADAVAALSRALPGSHGIVGDVADKADVHRIALQVAAALGGLDVLVNNASSLGPVPLARLADTECEAFEAALATNVLGPFRLGKALLGALAAAAREAGAAVVVNITSDAAVTPYAGWGAYAASKAALRQMSFVWDEELRGHGVRVLAIDPGDMDTPLHALAVPDADPATLARPRDAAREVLRHVADALREGVPEQGSTSRLLQHGGKSCLPQPEGPLRLPQPESTSRLPQHGSTSCLPQHESTSCLPQPERTSRLPQHGSTLHLPQHESTLHLPHHGDTSRLPQHGSTS